MSVTSPPRRLRPTRRVAAEQVRRRAPAVAPPVRTERGAVARVADGATPSDVITELVESFPTPALFTALLNRPGTPHPALVAALRGRGHYDALHYAVVDGTPAVLASALVHLADPDTWEVLAPAIVAAPAAAPPHLWSLARALAGADLGDVLVADVLEQVADRLEP